MNTNYVIACWSGPRRFMDPPYLEDRTWYIRQNLNILAQRKHNLSQITIVCNKNDKEDDSKFQAYLDSLPAKFGDTPVVILRREENIGQLFGAWSHVYDTYRTKFDYYILMEDDYVFLKDNFDTIMVDYLSANPGIGFLVATSTTSLGAHNHHYMPQFTNLPAAYNVPIYAASGAMPAKCLEAIKLKWGGIPYIKSDTYSDADVGMLFHAVANEGYGITRLGTGFRILNERYPVSTPPYIRERYVFDSAGGSEEVFMCSVHYTLENNEQT